MKPLPCLPAILTACTLVPAAFGQVPAWNPLDFPGEGPPGLPPGLPPDLPTPPVITPPAGSSTSQDALTWADPGGSPPAFFDIPHWQDADGLPPSGFAPGTPIDRDLFTGPGFIHEPPSLGGGGQPGPIQINLGSGSLTMTGTHYHNANPFYGGLPLAPANGVSGPDGFPASITVGSGSFLYTNYARHVHIAAHESTVWLRAPRADHGSGATFTGSTIDLSGGSSLGLLFADSTPGNPVDIWEMDFYLNVLSVAGEVPVLGLYPDTFEPGDNLLASPIMASNDGGITTFVGGWSFQAIPEPSALLLSLLALPLALRRRKN